MAAISSLDRVIDLQADLWAAQVGHQLDTRADVRDDISVIVDRKNRNASYVDMLARITQMDRLRKWAGLGIR